MGPPWLSPCSAHRLSICRDKWRCTGLHVLKSQQFAQVTPWLSLALRFTWPEAGCHPLSGSGVQFATDNSCTEAVRCVPICGDTSVLGTNLCFYGSVPKMGPWRTGPRRFPKSSCAVTVPPPSPPQHTAFAPSWPPPPSEAWTELKSLSSPGAVGL